MFKYIIDVNKVQEGSIFSTNLSMNLRSRTQGHDLFKISPCVRQHPLTNSVKSAL